MRLFTLLVMAVLLSACGTLSQTSAPVSLSADARRITLLQLVTHNGCLQFCLAEKRDGCCMLSGEI
ncbi:hypothetical protein [Pantoea sp.]|uniref:hypothetical protein n=1 Tax=Pantoea sp. TaxID=69393 RepID=UPI0028A6DDFA|nr:hypothetical protein [Pantoea sp.]